MKVGGAKLDKNPSEESLDSNGTPVKQFDGLKVKTLNLDPIITARDPMSTTNEKVVKFILKGSKEKKNARSISDSLTMPSLFTRYTS